MPSSTQIGRRTVQYQQFSDLLEDARRLAAGPHRMVGNWTYAQVLEHVASAMDMAFDGAEFRAPWLLRTFAPLFKNAVLTRPMKPGFRLPRAATNLLPAPDVPLDAALAHLEHAVGRFETEDPNQPHPFLGRLTRSEYVQLHLRHSALHMSFVVPDSPA
jgi:Protein of unknown function (DUF1569)